MSTLEPDAFWGLDEVKDLYLDGISATRLTPFSFRGLANVAHLYLRRTKVAVIEPHAFSGLINVAYLHMDESKIRHIQVGALLNRPLKRRSKRMLERGLKRRLLLLNPLFQFVVIISV